MSAPIAIQIAKGEDITFICTHVSAPGGAAGSVDITGWTITVTIKDSTNSITLTKPGVLTTPTQGGYTWAIVNADTATLRSGTYLIDIWRVDSGGRREMGFGTFTIAPDELFGG